MLGPINGDAINGLNGADAATVNGGPLAGLLTVEPLFEATLTVEPLFEATLSNEIEEP